MVNLCSKCHIVSKTQLCITGKDFIFVSMAMFTDSGNRLCVFGKSEKRKRKERENTRRYAEYWIFLKTQSRTKRTHLTQFTTQKTFHKIDTNSIAINIHQKWKYIIYIFTATIMLNTSYFWQKYIIPHEFTFYCTETLKGQEKIILNSKCSQEN